MVHLGKRFNTHSVHLLESESLQIFLATLVVRGNVIVTADVEVKTLQLKNRLRFIWIRLIDKIILREDIDLLVLHK